MLKSERRRRLLLWLLRLTASEFDIAESERDDEDGESELFDSEYLLDSSIWVSSSFFGAKSVIRFLLFIVFVVVVAVLG